MAWENRITVDPAILLGKPVIKGTRLAVEFIVGLLAQGWAEEEVLRNYPGIEREDILACLAYAQERLQEERVYPLSIWKDVVLRILANENIPGEAVALLRERGHDVVWIRTDSPGTSDNANLARAVAEQRLLLTFDKDFGELVFRRGQKASCGVILFRFSVPSSLIAAEKILNVLESRTDWVEQFSVVDDRHIRIAALPTSE
jgi:uncharacterized protein (DUF433 family)/predicted nuclease of predicted toxin-antitoxin system